MSQHIAQQVGNLRARFRERPEQAAATDPQVRIARTGPLTFRAVDEAGHVAETDMPVAVGGGGGAMSPGSMLRSALGCCNASTVAMEAAARGIELSRLEVTVESHSDNRGFLGLDGVEAGPLGMTVAYRLAAPGACDEELLALVEFAETHSPVRSALHRTVPVTVRVEIAGRTVVG